MRGGCYIWRMDGSSMMLPTMMWTKTKCGSVRQRSRPSRLETRHEVVRCHRPRPSQSARVHLPQFADYDRDFGWRGIAGGDAVARHWTAATGFAPAGEVRPV